MDRMLVVVFDNETKAYEGKKALGQLDNEGSISVYGYAVVAKNKDGSASIKQGDDVGPLGSLGGTALGSLIGALFGPVGLAVGASAGFAGGASFDLLHAGVGDDFIDAPKLKKTGRRPWTPAWRRSAELFTVARTRT